jgi:hypothetical protein
MADLCGTIFPIRAIGIGLSMEHPKSRPGFPCSPSISQISSVETRSPSIGAAVPDEQVGVEVDHSEGSVFDNTIAVLISKLVMITCREQLSGAGLCMKISINNDRLFGLWYL